MKRYVGPVALQDLLAEGINFALEHALHPGSLKAEIEPTNACKKGCKANGFS